MYKHKKCESCGKQRMQLYRFKYDLCEDCLRKIEDKVMNRLAGKLKGKED